MTDTTPGGLTSHPHRRVSDHRMQAVINSDVLKLLQHVVTAILLPMAVWGFNKLDNIEKATQLSAIEAARLSTSVELRLKALEQAGVDMNQALKVMQEQSIRQGSDIERLKDKR